MKEEYLSDPEIKKIKEAFFELPYNGNMADLYDQISDETGIELEKVKECIRGTMNSMADIIECYKSRKE
ncbi:MAG: hypothetical protein KAJ47_01430 [Candidatus Aenigmarchaeota archaeon]|nr:hypothetical protein [Candidatus Aenigmarchaeota archaeon]